MLNVHCSFSSVGLIFIDKKIEPFNFPRFCFTHNIIFKILIILLIFADQEYEIDKTLGIKGPEDVEKMGIAAYNAECRKIVMRYSTDWEVRGCQDITGSINSSEFTYIVIYLLFNNKDFIPLAFIMHQSRMTACRLFMKSQKIY